MITNFDSIEDTMLHFLSIIQKEEANKNQDFSNLINNVRKILIRLPVGRTFNFMSVNFNKIEDNTFSIEEKDKKEPSTTLAESDTLYTLTIYAPNRATAISTCSKKQVDIKKLRYSHAISAIIGEIMTIYPEEKGYDPKNIADSIISSISFDDNIIYKSKTGRLLINMDGMLISTEQPNGAFIFKTEEAEKIVQENETLLHIIAGIDKTKTIWTVYTIPTEYLHKKVNPYLGAVDKPTRYMNGFVDTPTDDDIYKGFLN